MSVGGRAGNSGLNPSRRNRNIGTARQGHGADNRLTVPSPFREERTWWEQLKRPIVTETETAGTPLRFIMDAHRPDSEYVCSPADITQVLALIPPQDWSGLTTFVFRQSTRKQWLLNPTWGRLAMSADIGERGRKNLHTGPAIILEALDLTIPFRWGRSLTPAVAMELERLRADGHIVVEDSRGYAISSSLEAARKTQLYRTIPHEIGHWVDWLERVERPAAKGDEEYETLAERYWSRPSVEREAFAHQYADRLRSRLRPHRAEVLPSAVDPSQVAHFP
jgi:hypothetical protein